jgi:RNA:NAD 2'-phosphotransferase (TPT1/KptA family)
MLLDTYDGFDFEHEICYVRHAPEDFGVHMRSDGFVVIEEILTSPKLKHLQISIDDIQSVAFSFDFMVH